MAGPTPVSALIHAATMVTAGVYLCCRMYTVFDMAPEVMMFISITGAVTLLVAGFAALVQTDIKRILAYSTMSQLGYMFMAVGAEAYQAGLFHMLTHAFFKALSVLVFGCSDFRLTTTNKTSSKWAVCSTRTNSYLLVSPLVAVHWQRFHSLQSASSRKMRSWVQFGCKVNQSQCITHCTGWV